MNCQEARESLSTLLDGDIGLTERVPLELHVSACADCREKLADLQAVRLVADEPAPRPVHHWHWPPVLAADTVGRALGFMRRDDVVTHIRRLVFDRFPPRHLAIAAAVPLVAILAIFVFERGFKVGTAMRQRTASPLASVTLGPASPPAPRSGFVESASPVPPPAAAPQGLPPRPMATPRATPPPVSASKPEQPKSEQKKVAEVKIAETKPAEIRAAEMKNVTRSVSTDAEPKPARPAVPAAVAPVKASLSSSTPVKSAAATRNAVDVVGRLRVKSRTEAERDLGALVARAGGTFVNRQHGPATTVVEARVPHAGYGAFAQGMARLGTWQLEAERSPLPDLVHVTVRLAE